MPDDMCHSKRYDFSVNQEAFSTSDPMPTGRGVLDKAGLRPANQYMLLHRAKDGVLEDVGLDSPVSLRPAGAEEFLAFHSDRLFFFLLDEQRYPWGESKICEQEIRDLGRVPPEMAILLDRRDLPDEELNKESIVNLTGAGVERLYTRERSAGPVLVEVFLDNEPKRILSGLYETETLKKALGVAASWELDILEGGVLRPLKPGETFVVVACMHFISHVRQGGSS